MTGGFGISEEDAASYAVAEIEEVSDDKSDEEAEE